MINTSYHNNNQFKAPGFKQWCQDIEVKTSNDIKDSYIITERNVVVPDDDEEEVAKTEKIKYGDPFYLENFGFFKKFIFKGVTKEQVPVMVEPGHYDESNKVPADIIHYSVPGSDKTDEFCTEAFDYCTKELYGHSEIESLKKLKWKQLENLEEVTKADK